MIPIIDTHQHLWDLKKFKLAWVKDGDPLNASYTPKEYAIATEGLNVVKSVYMEVDVVEEQQQAEADYLIELIKSKTAPTPWPLWCRAGPRRKVSRNTSINSRQARSSKGIRQVIHVDSTPPGFCLKPESSRVCNTLERSA